MCSTTLWEASKMEWLLLVLHFLRDSWICFQSTDSKNRTTMNTLRCHGVFSCFLNHPDQNIQALQPNALICFLNVVSFPIPSIPAGYQWPNLTFSQDSSCPSSDQLENFFIQVWVSCPWSVGTFSSFLIHQANCESTGSFYFHK